MKYCFIALITICTFQFAGAQDLKKSSKSFEVPQDDDMEILLTMKVPESTDITSSKDYAIYSEGKNSLTIDYTLEDDADITVPRAVNNGDIDLLKYSVGLPNRKIAGSSDYIISNKVIDGTIANINGLSCVKITYDYVHNVSAAIAEKGKVVMYLIKTKGTSLVHTEEHQLIVCLKFDEQQADGNTIDKVATAISKTIMVKKA